MKYKIEKLLPEEIEKRSFEIIEEELKKRGFEEKEPGTISIIKRVIHTSADFDYAENLYFSQGVVGHTMEVLTNKPVIITDTNMGKAGINKAALEQFGCEIHCFMADKDVAEEAQKRGVTRANASMEKAFRLKEEGILKGELIFAVGNAPTALITLHELILEKQFRPALVIAVPVGFVNVVEAKEMIEDLNIHCIVARGRKGGSNVAAGICNALLYLAKAGLNDKSS
jgi:precorrin-8X/cobalt-precorrin-8 methylmutase